MGELCRRLKIGIFSEKYDIYFKKYCQVKNHRVCKAIGWIESGYGIVRGAHGEIGIMQIMPYTGALLGYSEKQLWIAESNIECGCLHLYNMHTRFGGDLQQTIIAYNYGGMALEAKINAYGTAFFEHLPKTVQNYWNRWYNAYTTLSE